MGLAVAFIIVYLLLVALAFFSHGNWINGKRSIKAVWLFSLGLLTLQAILFFGFELTLRGIWVDRAIPLIFIISGAALFSLFRKHLPHAVRWVSAILFFYPLAAVCTFLIDRLFFVIAAAPLLAPLDVPRIHYSDDRFDIRTMTGLLAPAWLELVEKKGLVESTWGTGEGYWAQDIYPQLGELMVDSDTAKVFVFTLGDSSFVWTFNPQ